MKEDNMRKKDVNISRSFLLMAILFILSGCGSNSSGTQVPSPPPTNESKVTITKGVWGNVLFWEGNFMPRPVESGSSSGKITPVIRNILVCQATTMTEMSPYGSGPLFSQLPSTIIAETSSDETGFYQVALPPGTYSVFVKEGPVFYANSVDKLERVNPVEVLPGKVTKLQLNIQYKAYF
jgi:hypothetical protein